MKKALHLLDEKGEEVFLVALTTVMVLVIAAQVFMRYVMNNSLYWSEELARYIFVWSVWIGFSYAIKKGRHIRVDILRDVVKGKGKLYLDMFSLFVFLAFSIFLFRQSFLVVDAIRHTSQLSPALLLPMWIPNAGVTIGLFLGLIRLVQSLVLKFKEIKNYLPESGVVK